MLTTEIVLTTFFGRERDKNKNVAAGFVVLGATKVGDGFHIHTYISQLLHLPSHKTYSYISLF